jgi:hypothetical protein
MFVFNLIKKIIPLGENRTTLVVDLCPSKLAKNSTDSERGWCETKKILSIN